MMRSLFGRRIGNALTYRSHRTHKARGRGVEACVEGLESRNLLTGGTVVQSGVFVYVTPTSTGPNTAIVSYQNVNGTLQLDVNLNGVDNDFNPAQVGFVYYEGSSSSGAQTFENETSAFTVAWGGSGSNLFEGGSRSDEFFGGSGSNTFDAGTGYSQLIGGTGANVFNESSVGSGMIVPVGTQNTVNTPAGSTGTYHVL